MTESVNNETDTIPELRRPAPVTVKITTRRVACDGDDSVGLGHPRVWLAISPETGFVDCGYCDKRYVLDAENTHEDH